MGIAVSMEGISRRYGPVQALDSVGLRIEKGEIHALVGENGAGKTTLMRLLYGSDRPDSGKIELEGVQVHFHTAADGIAAGIGMVSQHYSIIPELTCLDNLILGAEPSYLLSRTEIERRAEELASRMNFQFNWHALAETLSPSGAQKLEILKLLWRNARIMILDEPTAMLSPTDSDTLFSSLNQLTEAGATVIVVTHRIPEVLEHCQTVTVLRGGKLVESRPVAGCTAAELAELIVGKPMDTSPRPTSEFSGEVRLRCEGLVAKGYRGNDALRQVSFEVRKGEILGIAGVDGSGQRELFWSLAGKLPLESGSIWLDNQEITQFSVRERINLGMRLIAEDRHEEAIVDDWPLTENAAIGLQRHPAMKRGLWIDAASRQERALSMARHFSTKYGSLSQPIRGLSGGNQQRFVAGRSLELDPEVILAFQPARGLDIEAARLVYEAIALQCEQGACAIVVSFDLDELLANCDRVLAMNSGKIYSPRPGLERDRKEVGELMVAT